MAQINIYESNGIPTPYPLLATRGLVVMPGTTASFDVGRKSSIQAVDEAMHTGRMLVLSSQKDISIDDPEADDIFSLGTLVKVKQVMRIAEDNVRILVKGVDRVSLTGITKENGRLKTYALKIVQPEGSAITVEHEASMRMLKDLFTTYNDLFPKPLNRRYVYGV